MTKICVECGNYINTKPNYVLDDFESKSPYCQTCWDESVSEEEEEEEKLTLKTYTFLTGEMIEIIATSLEEAEEKLENGEYTNLETHTELKHVGNA